MAIQIDRKSLLSLLKTENDRIMDLLITCNVPDTIDDESYEDYLLPDNKSGKKAAANNNKARTTQLDELEERLNTIRNKMKAKKRPATSERALKKREVKKLKKNKEFNKVLVSAAKSMKNQNQKLNGIQNGHIDGAEDKKQIKQLPVKPVFNEEGKIVFSKFDFSSHPGAKVKKSHQNPRVILNKINQTNKKLKELKEMGEVEKAAEIKTDLAWQKAFEKISGKKVKDDPKLLVKAIKKRKVEKKKSKKQWSERKQKVEDEINQKQKQRNENLSKRIKDKKNKKLKRLSKKGRIVPGF